MWFRILAALAAFLFLCGAQGQDERLSDLLFALVILLPAARLAGMAVERLGQPAVLGELIAGVLLGNANLLGISALNDLQGNADLEMLANLGVILLLFEVGLDSSLADLMKVGVSALMVALIGVALPFALGWGVSAWLLPLASVYVHAFMGATLCATSVGITARVLKDIDKTRSAEARVILGAAVIDDILGLVILAIVTGMIAQGATGGSLSVGAIGWLIFKVVLFFTSALLIGIIFVPRLFHQVAGAKSTSLLFTLSLALCFLLAYLSTLIDLAAIVGAFAAGLILERIPFDRYLHPQAASLEDLLHPVSTFLVPLFFVQMGLKLDLTSLLNVEVLTLAAALTLAAIAGKQATALGCLKQSINRLAVGIGMIPRGEVGLIFAGAGLNATIGDQPIFNSAVFAAVVIMVMMTTLITPPLLQWSFNRKS